MNWMRDIYEDNEPTSIWKKIGMVLVTLLFLVFLWGIMAVASAYEEHKLCMNGAIEHCIPEDFN